MAIKINNNTVIANNRRGAFLRVNSGAYSQQQLDDIVISGVAVGDIVYNRDQEAVNYWDGVKWIPNIKVCGEIEYRNPGEYTFVPPPGVSKVCAVCVGAGGAGGAFNYTSGGGGGGLGWKNNIPVTPGSSYKVVVGKGGYAGSNGQSSGAGGSSYFINTGIVAGHGGKGGNSLGQGGTFVGEGGGNGGSMESMNIVAHAGSGAGGYSGDGGNSMNNCGGRGGKGGAAGAGTDTGVYYGMRGTGGGGTGIYGEGTSGAQSFTIYEPNANPNQGSWKNYCANVPGNGGSPAHGTGNNGQTGSYQTERPWAGGNGNGGFPGGGGGQQDGGAWLNDNKAGTPGKGGDGAVRLIWGQYRAFPNTATGKDDCPDTQPPVTPVEYERPRLISPGEIPTVTYVNNANSFGDTITCTGAIKEDGSLPSVLQYRYQSYPRNGGEGILYDWSSDPSIRVHGNQDTYRCWVRAVAEDGYGSDADHTNECNVKLPDAPPPAVDPNVCGNGVSADPQWPYMWSESGQVTVNGYNRVVDISKSYPKGVEFVQYAAFFTKNGTIMQTYSGNNGWQDDGRELITSATGSNCRVRLPGNVNNEVVYYATATIQFRSVGNSSFSGSNSGSRGRSGDYSWSGWRLGWINPTLAKGNCKGNTAHLVVYAGCLFDRQGHYLWGSPSTPGWGEVILRNKNGQVDNYTRMYFKYFGLNPTEECNCQLWTEDNTKVVAGAGKTYGQRS